MTALRTTAIEAIQTILIEITVIIDHKTTLTKNNLKKHNNRALIILEISPYHSRNSNCQNRPRKYFQSIHRNNYQ